MSRPARLPPRCPFQNKGSSSNLIDSKSSSLHVKDELHGRHRRFPSQSSVLDEQPPPWLDDLLSDSDDNVKVMNHRRSSSDSIVISSGAYQSTSKHEESGDSIDLEADSCIYGPNSPRRNSNLTHLEKSVVSALSEYVHRNPLQYLAGNEPNHSEICQSGSAGDVDSETKAEKRHSGQHSRVRRLQYIAELERTVYALQALESELVAKVASLSQQRAILSLKNKAIKQQIAIIQQEKMVKDGQYLSLKNEFERLKMIHMHQSKTKNSSYFQMGPNEAAPSETACQMLGMAKLSLSGNPVPLKQGFRG